MDRRHHDFIQPEDFPTAWRGLQLTVEVEAKAKELAVLRLHQSLTTPGGIGVRINFHRRGTGHHQAGI